MGRKKRRSDGDILRAMVLHSDPVLTAPELAELVDYTADGVRKRLKKMEEDGFVRSKDVGARSVVWWVTEKGEMSLQPDSY